MTLYLLNKDILSYRWREKTEGHVVETATYRRDLTSPSERSYASVGGSSLKTSS